MTTAPVDADLECAAADLQHAIHLVGVANRCGDDPVRADVLAEALTLIRCAEVRLLTPGVSDPDPVPDPDVVTIAARDLRIGDRFYLMPQRFVVRGIERADDHVLVALEEAPCPPRPRLTGYGVKYRWPNSRPVYVLTPRPGDDGAPS